MRAAERLGLDPVSAAKLRRDLFEGTAAAQHAGLIGLAREGARLVEAAGQAGLSEAAAADDADDEQGTAA
jgi:hypothetical protein